MTHTETASKSRSARRTRRRHAGVRILRCTAWSSVPSPKSKVGVSRRESKPSGRMKGGTLSVGSIISATGFDEESSYFLRIGSSRCGSAWYACTATETVPS